MFDTGGEPTKDIRGCAIDYFRLIGSRVFDMVVKNGRFASLRLPDYDYSQAGMYFVTITTQNRVCYFGRIDDGGMQLSQAGQMVEQVYLQIPQFYPHVDIDAYVVMPNHFHALISLGSGGKVSLPDVVQRFKSLTTNRYINGVKELGWPRFEGKLWGANYYEHVVRNEADYLRIYEYIENNPEKWKLDRFWRND